MESGNKLIWGIVSLAFAVVIGIILIAGLRDSTINGEIFNSTHYCAGGTVNATGCASGTATLIPAEYTASASIVTKLATAPTWIGILVVVGFAALVYGFVQIFRGGENEGGEGAM